MLRPSMSSLAYPAWTLDRLADAARDMGYLAVELATFGYGTSPLACEPAHTCPRKTLAVFDEAGVAVSSLATSLRYDQPIRPPVLGLALDDLEGPVRQGKRMIDLAAEMGCPLVRVRGMHKQPRERLSTCARRIAGRLFKVVDHSRNTAVRVCIENAGSFPTARSLMPIVEQADLQGLLAVGYDTWTASRAGESLTDALNLLGDRIELIRIRHDPDKPDGPRQILDTLRRADLDAWVVYELDQLWARDRHDPRPILESFPAMVLDARAQVA